MALLKREPIPAFGEYIKKLVKGLDLEEEEKKELEEEWEQHLYDHLDALLKEGLEKEDAVRVVISEFGEIEMLQEEVNNTYPSSVTQHVQKEAVIITLILFASIIGPGMLIGARFQVYFITAPLQGLLLGYFLYRFIVRRLTHPVLSLVTFSAIYLYFLQLLSQMIGSTITFDLLSEHIFSLEWERLTGPDGLFQFPTIHMMWYAVIVSKILSRNNHVSLWKRVVTGSAQYWSMLLFGVLLSRMQSSAEMGVLFLNVFLLYGFLQQTLSIPVFRLWKEKMYHLILRKEV